MEQETKVYENPDQHLRDRVDELEYENKMLRARLEICERELQGRPALPDLLDLPSELISTIGFFLQAQDVGSFRLTNRELSGKMGFRFCHLFKEVKILLIGTSIQAVRDITRSAEIAKKIEHLTVGTETLEQYRQALMSKSDTFRTMLAHDGDGSRFGVELQNLILSRLPNLKTITTEDPCASRSNEAYRSGIGSTTLRRSTGIYMRWNPKYTPEGWTFSEPIPYPFASRSVVYDTIFDMLRHLDTHFMFLVLRIIVRGIQTQHGGFINAAFDLTDTSTRSVLDSHLTHLEYGEKGFRTRFDADTIREQREYALSRGISLIQWSTGGKYCRVWGRDGQERLPDVESAGYRIHSNPYEGL